MELVIEPEKIDWFLENMVEDEDSEVAQDLREAKENGESVYVREGETVMAPIAATLALQQMKGWLEKAKEEEVLEEILEEAYEESDNEERTREVVSLVRSWPEEPLPEEEKEKLVDEMEEMVSEGEWFNFMDETEEIIGHEKFDLEEDSE